MGERLKHGASGNRETWLAEIYPVLNLASECHREWQGTAAGWLEATRQLGAEQKRDLTPKEVPAGANKRPRCALASRQE